MKEGRATLVIRLAGEPKEVFERAQGCVTLQLIDYEKVASLLVGQRQVMEA
jgi:hypothetical protein